MRVVIVAERAVVAHRGFHLAEQGDLCVDLRFRLRSLFDDDWFLFCHDALAVMLSEFSKRKYKRGVRLQTHSVWITRSLCDVRSIDRQPRARPALAILLLFRRVAVGATFAVR